MVKNNLKQLRKAKGLTQQQLADLAGTTQNTISSIETGQYSPSIATAQQLCVALECRFTELFDLQEGVSNWQPYSYRKAIVNTGGDGLTINLCDSSAQVLFSEIRAYVESDAILQQARKRLDECGTNGVELREALDACEDAERKRDLCAFALSEAVVSDIYKPLMK